MALTSLSVVKDILGITVDTYDTQLTNYINSASAAIENYCDRTFAQGVYTELRDAKDFKIILKNRPINYIISATYGEQQAIKIVNGNSVDVTITIDNTQVVYVPSDTMTATTMTYAVYTTITSLNTAIDALTGITSTVINGGNPRTLYTGTITLGAGETGYISMTSVKSVLGRLGDGFYAVDNENPHIIIYNGGYATIPADLVEVCNKMVCILYESKVDGTLQSETIGDYSYTNGTIGGSGTATDPLQMILLSYTDVLENYKNMVI